MSTKMTIFYNEFGGGFSETFYHASDDPFALAQTIPNDLYQKAAKFRHIGCIIKGVRFARVGGQRRSILVRPYPKAQGTRFTTAEKGPDVISTTAVYQLYSVGLAKRMIWCRGLADMDIVRDEFGNDSESATLEQMRNQYFLALNQNQFRIQFVNRPPDLGLTWRRITIVFGNNPPMPNRAWFTPTVALPEFNVGDVLSVSGIPSSLPRFPRKLEITNKQTIAGVVSYQFAYALPGNVDVVPKNLRVTTYTAGTETIGQWAFVRFGSHKTGRPFGSLRGRARVAASLR